MKTSDLANLKKIGSLTLTEWVIKGDHSPHVDIYEKGNGEYYQVSLNHMKYRKTEPTKNDSQILEYGDWLDLQN